MPNPTGNSGVIVSSELTFITNEQGQHLGDRFGVYGLTPEEIKIVEGAAK